MKKSLSCTLLGFLVFLQPGKAHADVLAEWTFNTGGTSALRRTAGNVAAGVSASTLDFNASFTFAGTNNVPNDANDGFGFGGNNGDTVIFLHRANYFDNSTVPDPRPTEESYTSWGVGAAAGTGSDLPADGNAPIAFTVTADAVSTISLDSLTVDFTGGAAIVFQFQEAGANPGTAVTIPAGTVQDTKFTVPLDAPVVIGPGQTKTFTINLNSGNLNSGHIIDGIALNGAVTQQASPPIAEWTFNAGGASAERRAASNVTSGATVSTLNFNDSFTDVGVDVVPNDANDGIGFGGNLGDQVIFLHRANYFDNSTVPDPRPTEGSYTSWGLGTLAGTGSDLPANGNAPIAFNVTADAVSTITLDSLTVDFTSGAAIIFQFQEAGASPGRDVTLNTSNPLRSVSLAAPVVIGPGQTKTFTINLNSGSLNSGHNIDGITLNGTVNSGSDPYQDWALVNAPGQNPDKDYDGDGVPNAVEFVLGGDKDTNDLAKLPMLAASGGNMTFTFERNQASVDDSVSVAIEVGTDLVDWSTSYAVPAVETAGPPVAVVKNSPSGKDTVTLTVPQTPDARKFARLSVIITQ